MPLNEEDYRELAAEQDANPAQFREWDPNDSIRKQHQNAELNLHSEAQGSSHSNLSRDEVQPGRLADEVEHLSTLSSSSTSDASAAQYEGLRTRPAASLRNGRSVADSLTDLHRSETNRINGGLEAHPEALDRIRTQRSQHLGTVGSRASTKNKLQLNFGAGKPFPPPLPGKEEYVVEFDGPDDPLLGQNWPVRKKTIVFLIAVWAALNPSFGSAIFSAASDQVEEHFHVGFEVTTLGTSLFVLGYAVGPVIWAPMSELYGRRLPINISGLGFAIFTIAVATAANIQTVMICRFFAGVFGACPLTVVAAIFADIFSNETRGLAIAGFSSTVIMGPLLAPFIGGFISQSYLGWRWTEYISSFMGFSGFVLSLFFLEETYPPVILVAKAAELRRQTKNWGIHAKQEEIEVDFRDLVTKNLARPIKILFTEPIVLLISIYLAFIYGLLYTFLTAYALVFQNVYGMNEGVSGLPYFGLIIGCFLGFTAIFIANKSYAKKLKANNNVPIPEWRLPIVMLGGPIFAGGLLWFGWTGYTGRVPWIVPTLSGLFSGFGFFTIFLQLLNYIIDAYLMFAASAVAGNQMARAVFGAAFPLFATYMYNGIGIEWGQTVLGCFALLLVPLPFIFYVYGRKIRAHSTIAPALDIEQDKRRDEESRGQANNTEAVEK